ncbi:acylphosphatase [Agarivorans sp. B2Z047]|nr:acylphosphatase [Agarivorans sp. B2Z047]
MRGVGYRYHTQLKALKLDLVGYAKNLDSGDVEVVAEGEEAKLIELLSHLHQASPYAAVQEVKTLKMIPIEQLSYSGFNTY